MVARSRLRSATVDPAAAWPSPPPNISDSPPPFPLCSRIMPISSSETMTWMTMMIDGQQHAVRSLSISFG